MKIEAVDVGLVSPTDALVDFYVQALQLPRLEPRVFPFATVHRLACGPVTLKVMVPVEAPVTEPPPMPFWTRGGHRYFTLWVDDISALAASWVSAGGTVIVAPTQVRPGVHSALLADPDANVLEVMQETAAA
ncbi:MAG TPA: VOC family protein [Frankiaceae bacterium]|jgi:hypothetical protein|nr:VOC family protein [Frankiaceae bacterium]